MLHGLFGMFTVGVIGILYPAHMERALERRVSRRSKKRTHCAARSALRSLRTAQTPDPPSALSPCGSSSSELRGEPPAHISLECDGDPSQPHSRAR